MLCETGIWRWHRLFSLPHSLPLSHPQLMDGSRLPHRLLMYQQPFHVSKGSDFVNAQVFNSCEMLIPVFTVLQIPLWLDFGLVSQSSWFSCFLCWLCWPRQEPHTKSKFGLFLKIYKAPQGTGETEIVYRAAVTSRAGEKGLVTASGHLWVGSAFLLASGLWGLFSSGSLWTWISWFFLII